MGKLRPKRQPNSGGPEKQKLGGRVVNNLLWRPLSEKMENVFGRQRGPLLTVHPLGGCSMGNNVREGVTDHCGRVFNAASRSPTDCYEGLVVLDGSFVPSSLGINPALTIAVLSLRALDRLKPQWQLTGGRLASPPGDASFSDQMRPPFAESVVKSDPIKTALELTEQIRGPVFLRAPDGKIRPHMVEITITTDMIEVDQLIGRDASKNREIDPGKGHLLAGRLFTLRKGRLRILRAGANFDFVSDEAYHGDVALSANLSGAVRMFSLERSRGCTRIFRALVAWFLNRGLRDIVQSAIERALEWVRYKPPTEHKKSAIRIVSDYIRDVIGLCSRAGAVRLIEYELWIDSVVSSGARHSKTTENDLKSAQSDKVGYFHRGAFEKEAHTGRETADLRALLQPLDAIDGIVAYRISADAQGDGAARVSLDGKRKNVPQTQDGIVPRTVEGLELLSFRPTCSDLSAASRFEHSLSCSAEHSVDSSGQTREPHCSTDGPAFFCILRAAGVATDLRLHLSKARSSTGAHTTAATGRCSGGAHMSNRLVNPAAPQ